LHDRGVSVAAMLDARTVAVVGASPRPDSFGNRMVIEAGRGRARVHLVNPRYADVGGRPCLPSVAEIGEPVDLVLLGVGDHAVATELAAAAAAGARSAVVFGSAPSPGLRDRLGSIARSAGMALCGGGCMGFVNVPAGLRALGYLERDPIPAGPVSLVTHSGSVFSTLLRTRRAIGFRLAVSSGQELVTSTADYLEYVLDQGAASDEQVVGLVMETVREPERLRVQLRRAADLDVPVVLLPVGRSAAGSRLVSAHSGAIAGADGAWRALAADTGALAVHDLAELTDTLELLVLGRRPRAVDHGTARRSLGLAAVHDSGAERALTADLAQELEVPVAGIGPATRDRLAAVLDEGLAPVNPLDVWGTGADPAALLRECLGAMAADPAVGVTVLAVDLVPEYDGDTSYPDAVLAAAADARAAGHGPVAVLAGLPSAVDDGTAQRLRAAGVAVLEGTRSGLVALRHLLRWGAGADPPVVADVHATRQARWLTRLRRPLTGAEAFELLADYGVAAAATRPARDAASAAAAADDLGYPVVLKTDEPGIAHKSDVGGVVLGLADDAAVREAYADLAARLGRRVLVAATAPPGVEVSLGVVRDPMLGPMLVLGAGGSLVELLADAVVALPPVSDVQARALLGRLRIAPLLAGFRGAPAGDLAALVRSVVGMGQLAVELGDRLGALEVNPVLVSPSGALAVDVLVEPDESEAVETCTS
jgi:acyl-CoA synthetase (NDP forming)